MDLTCRSRLMVLAPHPDDETLAAGGLLQHAIAAGAAVRVLFLTAGDNNPWGQRLLERRWRIGPAERDRYARRRRSEAEAAMATLGVSADGAVWLDYKDQGLTQRLLAGDIRIVEDLAVRIGEWRPTLLVTPSPLDLHPDHSAAGLATSLAMDLLPADRRPAERLEYLVHARRALYPQDGVVTLSLSDRQQARKRQAVLCHASQVKVRPRSLLARAGDREVFLVPPDAPAEVCDVHAVRRAHLEGKDLRMQMFLGWRPRVFGRVTLVLLAWHAEHIGAVCRFVLPPRAWRVRKEFPLVGLPGNGGDHPALCAWYLGGRRGGEISIPVEALPPPTHLFAKVERRFGLYDHAGWREIPVPRPDQVV